jgi:3-phosphoshikimate 1-carboxyvinyltransferase
MQVTLPDQIHVSPLRPFEVTLRPPGSKSLTNRALLLASLADGESTIRRPLLADDTQRMLEALRALGFGVEVVEGGEALRVAGTGGTIPADRADLHLGNAGTAMRPLTAACCLGRGQYTLDGIARMRQRPIGELVEPLNQIGGRVTYLGEAGFPPLKIAAHGLVGGRVKMRPTLSSQFITALAMVAPCCEHGLTIDFQGPITSRPYVELTLGLMKRFGVRGELINTNGGAQLAVRSGTYRPIDYDVEPDASNATYLLAAAAIVPDSRCTVEGLGRRSLQGDTGFADVLERMGARVTRGDHAITVASPAAGRLAGIDIDLNHMPDAAMTLATIAAVAEGPTTIRNVGNWRVKETDRMAAMQAELSKLGATVQIDGDDITITPPPGHRLRPAAIDTYDDHRMAMSFAILGLPPESPGVTINDPRCVEKTFPDFFAYLDRLASDAHG